MKNRDYKICLFVCILLSGITFIGLLFTTYWGIKEYNLNNNRVVETVIANVREMYPDIDDQEIIKILNTEELKKDKNLARYGINVSNESISLANKRVLEKTIFINGVILGGYVLLIIGLLCLFNYYENRRVRKITNYIKAINEKNYELDILSNREDDLSLLKNEIYKTAVTLNEQALLLKNDKDTLKDSLSDISHQLKTPLTSITLMIDTLLDGESLSDEKKKEILNNIHRKIGSINFLVYSLLKLSKFDANTVEFKKEENCIKDILDEVLDNLAVLSDLRDVKIKVKGNSKDTLYCDFKWQVEALTNIVKNCLEYSPSSSKIEINYSSNEIFTKIVIRDYGCGMDEYDRLHIFDRFYKGKNSNSDSVGIGLALAKMIIEKDNGYILVDSKLGEGTTFTIKYLK